MDEYAPRNIPTNKAKANSCKATAPRINDPRISSESTGNTAAKEVLIERMAAETLAIADAPVGLTDRGTMDSGAVQKQRLQVDTRKWLLSKLAPERYGGRITNERAKAPGEALRLEERRLSPEQLRSLTEALIIRSS